MKGLVFAVLVDWAGPSISRDAANTATAALNMKEVSTIGVKLVRMRVAVPETSKFENDSIKRKETPLGVGRRDDSCITDPSSSPITVYRDKWLLTLSAKRTPLSASCSHPMLLEDREQAVDQGRWKTLAIVQDWLGCDACSYTNHSGFVAASLQKKLLMPTPSATTTCRDKVLGLWGWLCIRWAIEREAHWPRRKEIFRQHHHHARILSRISALALFVCSRSLGIQSRCTDRGDSSGTDEFYVGLLSPH